MQTNQDYSNHVFQDVENLMDWWENVECKSVVECLLFLNSILGSNNFCPILFGKLRLHETLFPRVNVYLLLKANLLTNSNHFKNHLQNLCYVCSTCYLTLDIVGLTHIQDLNL